MKAVILAAGEGSRMRPLTYTRPKVMLPIANRPILEHLVIEAKEAGITDFIFVVGYRDEQVRSHFGDGRKWGISIHYASQRKQLGTADAVRMVEGMIDGSFLLMNGDAIAKREDIRALVQQPHSAIGVFEVDDTAGLGVVQVENGYVVRIFEKMPNAPTNLANTGLYMLTPDIFPAVSETPKSPRGEFEITTSLQIMIAHGNRVVCHKIGYWLDLSYPWQLLTANQTLLADMESANKGMVEGNAVIKGPVSIGERTTIKSGAYITGPVAIGNDCDIGPNCYIRPHTSIGDGCHIGASVEVKNSIVMRGTKIPHLSYVGDSIIGEGCNLGAGTKIANLRLDEKDVTVSGISTKRRKFGAVMGDGVKTGINVSINVGTTIGNGCFIGPGAVVSGVVNPGSKVL